MSRKIKYFLGSKTKDGFKARFDELYHMTDNSIMYVLKGGAGSGKSTLMNRTAKYLEKKGENVEYIVCASDPDSLDCISALDGRLVILDGTPPHAWELKFPGIYEILIPMGDSWDIEKLRRRRRDILALDKKIDDCHKRAAAYVKAACILLERNIDVAEKYKNTDEIMAVIEKVTCRLSDADDGKPKKRLLSAVSVGSVEFLSDTIENICDTVYVVNDRFGAASKQIMNKIALMAEEKGKECIVCPCSILGDELIDHIIFPSLKMAVTRANDYHSYSGKGADYTADMSGYFSDEDKEEVIKNEKQAKELIERACAAVKQAKEIHDILEEQYKTVTNFKKSDEFYEKIISQIEKI